MVKNMTEYTDGPPDTYFSQMKGFTTDTQECARSATVSVVRGTPITCLCFG